MEAEHLSDWSKVTHGAGDKQDARLADLQSRVLFSAPGQTETPVT